MLYLESSKTGSFQFKEHINVCLLNFVPIQRCAKKDEEANDQLNAELKNPDKEITIALLISDLTRSISGPLFALGRGGLPPLRFIYIHIHKYVHLRRFYNVLFRTHIYLFA